LLVTSEDGRLLNEEFAAEVTLTAQFAVERFPAFQESLQELSHGRIEAEILSTNEATIMGLA
jgi:putative IMPACT (imprinted ancient) family translation regulator